MDYNGKKVFLTGATGFIGGALSMALTEAGAKVFEYQGDVRDKQELTRLLSSQRYDYVFHFGCPSSQVLFTRERRYCIETTIHSFMILSKLCAQNGTRLIYPSTGLLSQGKSNEYARCKQICEDLAAGSELDSLGIRIFATYGRSEGHKRDYASVPYLFARDMVEGRQPVIYGDGTQVRDFIWLDDVVNSILELAERCSDKVIDVGYGIQTSFNDLVRFINTELGTNIKPVYVDAPAGYVDSTRSTPASHAYYKPVTDIDVGIPLLVKWLQGYKDAV